ncbi:MAG: hypothetical protein PHH47_08670 [Gallionella sp.]|nr:hypothetical protein [Gallionella sp.]MDD4945881.1 hypothetical protein [Gallionella sp.]MDD5612080.1 hypothetical protein [Gallionella sp.]
MSKSAISTNAAYYEARGQSRTSLVLSVTHKDKLDSLAEQHKVAVGDVIEAMLDLAPGFENVLTDLLRAKKESKMKVDGRCKKAPKREILKSLAGLSKDQLAEIEAQIARMKANQWA